MNPDNAVRWWRLGPTGLLAIAWTALPAVIGTTLLLHLGFLSDFLLSYGSYGLIVFIAVFILSGGLGLLPTYAQAILAGWVFGWWLGLLGVLAGYTGASILGYLIARGISRDEVQRLVARNRKAVAVRNALVGKGGWRTLGIVCLIRIPPNSPFALTNLIMASLGVSAAPFVVGTVLGMLPRSGIAVAFAAAASAQARDLQQFVSEGPGWGVFILGFVTMIVVLVIIGKMANNAIARLDSTEPESEAGVRAPGSQLPSMKRPALDARGSSAEG